MLVMATIANITANKFPAARPLIKPSSLTTKKSLNLMTYKYAWPTKNTSGNTINKLSRGTVGLRQCIKNNHPARVKPVKCTNAAKGKLCAHGKLS